MSSLSTLYENARVYASILRDCSLPEVAEWKLEDVNRAFKWAQYFQKVHERIAEKESVINKLESKLKEISRTLCVRFGCEEFDYNFLIHHSLHYCTQALLDNPSLPDELHHHLQSNNTLLSPSNTSPKTDQETVAILFKINETMKSVISGEDQEIFHSLKAFDASFLREDISWLLETGASPGKQEGCEISAVEERLHSLALIDGGLEVIFLSLLLSSSGMGWLHSGPTPPSSLDSARKGILDWLIKMVKNWHCTKDTNTVSLWNKTHNPLVIKVCTTYSCFFEEALQVLVEETEALCHMMSVERCCTEQCEIRNTPDVAQQDKVEWAITQWTDLIQAGGQHIAEVCIPLLKSRALPHDSTDDELLDTKSDEQSRLPHGSPDELLEMKTDEQSRQYPDDMDSLWIRILTKVVLLQH